MRRLSESSQGWRRTSKLAGGGVRAEHLEGRVLFNQVIVSLTPGSSISVVTGGELDRIQARNFAALVTLSGTNIADTLPRPNQHVITGATTSIDNVSVTSGSGGLRFLLDGKGPVAMGGFSSAVPFDSVSIKQTTFIGAFTAPVTRLDMGQATGATIHVQTTGKPVAFTSGALTDTKFTFDNALRLFQSGAYTSTTNNASTLRAPFIDLMKINGDLFSNITLTGGANLALGRATLVGSMTGGFISATGNIGTVGGPTFTMTKGRISATGSIVAVSAAAFGTQARVTAASQVGMLKATGSLGGTFQFASLKTFSVGGNVDSASMQLTLPFSTTTFNLLNATVHGSMTNSMILSNGNMKRLSFGQIGSSFVWAGINPAASMNGATSPTDILNPARIDSFVTHSFASTDLAGGRLGAIDLGVINPANGGTTFGITGQLMQRVLGELGTKKLTLKNVINTATAQQQLQKLGITAQDLGDFMILLSQ